jgi:hypothetical protein
MMKYVFTIFWTQNGRLEVLELPALDLRSIDTAHKLAKNFAVYAPVSPIIIEGEDGSISELWFGNGRYQDIALTAG